MPYSRVVGVAFVAVAAANLVANATDSTLGAWLTKPLLMPLLAAYLWRRAAEQGSRADRAILVGLAFATLGDLALLLDDTVWFLIGMVCFLGTHVSYLVAFFRAGAAARLRRAPLVAVPAGYAVLTVAALVFMWDGLTDAGLALPVAGYSVALAAMASAAATHGWRIGLGGALFLGSDLLIAMDVAGAGTLPGPPIWVMATYAAGQGLIVLGWAARRRTPADRAVGVTPAVASAAR